MKIPDWSGFRERKSRQKVREKRNMKIMSELKFRKYLLLEGSNIGT